MILRLRRSSGRPLYKQIVAQIKSLIERGDLQPGQALPSSRRLAEKLGVDRSTVFLAYAELQALGFLRSRPGSYNIVEKRAKEAAYDPERKGVLDWDAASSPAAGAVLRAFRAHPPERGLTPRGGRALDLSSIEPDPRLYPLADVRRTVRRVLQEKGAEPLGYGDPQGYPPLREHLARRLRLHGISISGREILITNGAQQGLDLLVRVLGGPGRAAVVESPTYSSFLPLLRLHGLETIGIPMTDAGMDLEALARVLARTHPAFIYTMPNFHNPTGITTSHAHRQRLLDLAAEHGIPIIEDGFEEDMKYGGPVPLPIKSIDEHGLVAYVGTFSKALFPGFRVGWIAADRPLVERALAVKRYADLSTNALGQMVLQRFCETGLYDRHLKRVHLHFRRRMRVALRAAQEFFPKDAVWTRPVGGYTIWVRLPRRLSEDAFRRRLALSGVTVSPGEAYFPRPSPLPSPYFRVSIARLDDSEIREALRRLGRALLKR